MDDLTTLANQRERGFRIFQGLIAEDATGPNDTVPVRIPAYDPSRQFGPCHWAPRTLSDGSPLKPMRNDECLVALDENDQAEIINWWAEDPTTDPNLIARVGVLEQWRNGKKGAGRWYAPAGQVVLQAGWNWAAFSDFAADTDYFQLLTPPGTRPGGAGAFATNSGIKVLVAGVYRITAALLQSGASASGRYDTNLYILNGATGAVVATAESDLNNYVTGGSGYIRSKMSVELPLSVGNIVFPHNQALSAYGDAGGNWSNINLRYLGT